MNEENKQQFDQAISRLRHALDDTDIIHKLLAAHLQEIEQSIKEKLVELASLDHLKNLKQKHLSDLDEQIKQRQSELGWSGSQQEYVMRQLRAAVQTASEKPFNRGLRYDRNPYARQIQTAFTRAIKHRIDDLIEISHLHLSNGQIQERSELIKESRRKLADELRAARKRLRELKSMASQHPNSFAPVPPPLDDPDIPNESGVYFLWEESRVAYVGQSTCLARRLLNHPRLEPNDKISYLCIDISELFYHEAFYIGLCRPPRNRVPKLNGILPLSGSPSPRETHFPIAVDTR